MIKKYDPPGGEPKGSPFLLPTGLPQPELCLIEECDSKPWARSLCDMHYQRLRLTGTTDARQPLSEAERFWAKVEITDDCWNWRGRVNHNGYGLFLYEGRPGAMAHRASIEISSGKKIPVGMVIDHICHNPPCVNPTHLRVVTQKQNSENLAGPQVNNTSGVRGVSWMPRKSKWRARVMHDRKEYSAGLFASLAEAEVAVIELRNRLHTHNGADRQQLHIT